MGRPTSKTLKDASIGLSEERIEQLRQEAKEKVAAELREKQERELLEKFAEEERIALSADVDHDMVTFTLDLAAPQKPFILIDGTIFFDGVEYTKPRRVFDTLRDIQEQGYRHQAETDGKPRNYFMKEKHVKLGGASA